MNADTMGLRDSFVEMASLESPTYFEAQAANYVISRLEKLGIKFQVDKVGEKIGGNQGNIYALVEGELKREPRLFSAHLDTVSPCKGKKIICDETIHTDKTTILGADNCAAAVAILEALDIIKSKGIPHGPVELLFTVAEEVYGLGAEELDYSMIKSKTAFVPDMDGELCEGVNRAPTIIGFDVRVIGRASHAGFKPQDGISAINAAAKVISALQTGIIDSDTRVNIGTIQGGIATNIVPSECRIKGEIRSLNHEKALERLEIIKNAFKKECTCEFESRVYIHAYNTGENSRAVQIHRSALSKMGITQQLTHSFGGSDLNCYCQRGIEGIVIFGAMHNCHSVSEYTTLGELKQLTQLIINLIME